MYINKVKVMEAMSSKGIETQTELASHLGISKNQLSVILNENYDPLKSNIVSLCNFLDISPLEIIEEKPSLKQLSLDLSSVDVPIVTGSKDEVTCIELFAGGGGMALGLEQADINTLLHVEIDKACCNTLKTNRPDWNIICEDIAHIDFKPYKGVDLVTGGFPCQAFSYAGKKLGFEDTRGTLFYEFARCVKEVRPLAFVAENVRGLMSHDGGRTLNTIVNVLGSLGYNVQTKLLNSVNYGVPQKRERVVIVGTKSDIKFTYPEESNKIRTIRDALKDVPPSEGQSYSEAKIKVLELVPPGGCWRDLPLEVQKEYMGKSFHSSGGRTGMARRLSWDEPSLTLTCSPSQKQTERCHPDEVRPFTVREYARIQTFPDNWNFSGGIGAKYKQIGNAVPVELARQIGVQIKNAILNYKKMA